MANRATGQDTEISVIVDNVVITAITAVKNHEITYKMKTTEEEYCGESSPRMDDFFMGIAGKVEVDVEGIDAITLAEAIKDRARNRRSSRKIAIRTTVTLPDARRVILNVSDAKFSDIPFSTGGRSEYIKMTLTYVADDARVIAR